MKNRISALLVDDEIDNRELLANLLQLYFPEIAILGVAANVDEAYDLVLNLSPQLVFLDIQMPRGSGFNLLKKFETVPFEIIFVTSYDQYAINAIRFNALDYILKPVEIESLQEAIKRVVQKIEHPEQNKLQIVNLLYSLDSKNTDKRIAIHVSDKVKVVNISDVVYIQADGRYCQIFTNDGQHFTTAKVLKDFEDYLGQESPFIRINKSVLANALYIKSYSKGEPLIIEMIGNAVFEIPRRKKAEILERLLKN